MVTQAPTTTEFVAATRLRANARFAVAATALVLDVKEARTFQNGDAPAVTSQRFYVLGLRGPQTFSVECELRGPTLKLATHFAVDKIVHLIGDLVLVTDKRTGVARPRIIVTDLEAS